MPTFRLHYHLNLGERLTIDLAADTPEDARTRLTRQVKEEYPKDVSLHVAKIKLVRG